MNYYSIKIKNIQKFVVKNYKLQDFVQKYKGGRRPGMVKKFQKILLNKFKDFLRIIIFVILKSDIKSYESYESRKKWMYRFADESLKRRDRLSPFTPR